VLQKVSSENVSDTLEESAAASYKDILPKKVETYQDKKHAGFFGAKQMRKRARASDAYTAEYFWRLCPPLISLAKRRESYSPLISAALWVLLI